ncbi:MAG: toxic anion resistance protein [Bacillaceae bacterium]
MNEQNNDLLNTLLDDPFATIEEEKTPQAEIVEKKTTALTMMDRLSPELQQKAKSISEQITFGNQQSIMQFGVAAQSELSKFSDTVLQHVKTKNPSYISDSIEKLMAKIYEVEPEDFEQKQSLFGKLFKPFKKVQDLFNKYEKLNVEIDMISDELDKHRQNLTKDVMMLEQFYERNKNYFQALNVYIAAGEHKLDELQNVEYPKVEKQARETNDEMMYQRLKDLQEFINRLDKRVHDLKLSRQIAIQTAPQIRLIQGTNQTLVEKIQSSILNTIPLWKNQIVLAVSMNRQQHAINAQKQISKTTNDLLQKNAEKLKLNTIEAARENERSMVDIDTLKHVQKNLIETLQETMKIQEEGRINRQKAEQELYTMEQELKQALLDVGKK